MNTPRLATWMLLAASPLVALAAKDVPVPTTCTPAVNQGLAAMLAGQSRQYTANVMVCGIATQNSRVQGGGPHGSHHIISIAAPLPGGNTVAVQVVVNDSLDGVVTASTNDQVFALGQGYIAHGPWVAGIHDVHCSTHPTADNGWVVVAGVKTPTTCPRQ